MRSIDISNKKFGKLKAITLARKNGKHRYWNCVCDCGVKKVVAQTSLINSGVKSCGCSKQIKQSANKGWKGCGKISGGRWAGIKWKAQNRGIAFNVTIEQAWSLFEKQQGKCALTKIDLVFPSKNRLTKEGTASLDRIDSSKGYTLENLQWVHKDINWIKNKLTQQRFIELCKSVAQHN